MIGDDSLRCLKDNLKKLRCDKKLTQEDVCNELRNYGCFVNRSTYTKYETGDRTPSVKMLVALARCFGTTTDYILGLTDNPKCR